MSGFKVGVARREINYPDSLMPYPFLFGGRYNDLYTRAIVIDNGEVRCAIIGYDLAGPPDVADLKAYIQEKCGISAERLTEEKAEIYEQLASLNREIRAERRKLKLCQEIRQQIPAMEQDIQNTDEHQKEVQEHEHRRR